MTASPTRSPRPRGSLARAVLLSLSLGGSAAAAAAQVPRDSVPPATSGDSARRPDATGPPATPPGAVLPTAVPKPPTDTILAKACAGQPGGAQARGLLAAIFRAGTPADAQAAAANAVGGKLAGVSPYGESYVLIPDSAGPLRTVADRLIRQDPVTTVSPVPCPGQAAPPAPAPPAPVPPPPAGAPPDSAAGKADSTPVKGP